MADENVPFELPRPDQRVAVFGRTGSGKTQLGVWLLSRANFDVQPWVILDYKRDTLLNTIERIKTLELDTVPTEPGLHIIHLDPGDKDAINDWLRRVSNQENVGLYFDEVYEIPDSVDFRRILTQGRSKHVPAICLSQRPAWIPGFILSESEHIVCFHLQHKADRKRIEEFVPDDKLDLSIRLPKYHSRWYAVEPDQVYHLTPVPDRDALVAHINERLKKLEPDARRSWL